MNTQNLDALIQEKLKLEQEKIEIEVKLAEVDGLLIEDKLFFDKNGSVSARGTLPRLKSEQARLDGQRRMINIKLDNISKKISFESKINVSNNFIEICRSKLDKELFKTLLDEAKATTNLLKK